MAFAFGAVVGLSGDRGSKVAAVVSMERDTADWGRAEDVVIVGSDPFENDIADWLSINCSCDAVGESVDISSSEPIALLESMDKLLFVGEENLEQ